MTFNPKNTAIKRILADVRELGKHKSVRYSAEPLEENLFEWHFTIRGPVGTDFEGGIYHGRILLPPDYPFKPPNIIFTTKNGRFEVGTKICLSISAYHPEHWQPAWGVRTMLEAIISFLPTEGAGAIGALDWSPEERKRLAKESCTYRCSLCGPINKLLLEVGEIPEDTPDEEIRAQISQLHMHRVADNNSQKLSSKESAPDESTDTPASASRTFEEEGETKVSSSNTAITSPSSPSVAASTNTPLPVSHRPNPQLGRDASLSEEQGTSQAPTTIVPPPPPPPATPTTTAIPQTPQSIRAVRRRVLGQRHENHTTAHAANTTTDNNNNNNINNDTVVNQPAAPPPVTNGAIGRDFIDDILSTSLTLLIIFICIILVRMMLRYWLSIPKFPDSMKLEL